MTPDFADLMNRHLNDEISPEDQLALRDCLREDRRCQEQFVNAVLLDNRLRLHYRSLAADVDEFAAAQTKEKQPTRQRFGAKHLAAGTAVLMLAVCVGVYYGISLSETGPSAEAVTNFHELVLCASRPADRTYHVTFVKDAYDTAEVQGIIRPNDSARLPLRDAAVEATLYVRDGRQFVYSWTSPDGRKFAIGGNGKSSWAIRPDIPPQIGDPQYYTGGLPAGLFLVPILGFFDGQEQMLLSNYDVAVRSPDKANRLFVAMKKPDTKQGPRRIEILFSKSTQVISEMRIWPATSDHRRTNHTLIQLVSEQSLDADFFMPEFYEQRIKQNKTGKRYHWKNQAIVVRHREFGSERPQDGGLRPAEFAFRRLSMPRRQTTAAGLREFV